MVSESSFSNDDERSVSSQDEIESTTSGSRATSQTGGIQESKNEIASKETRRVNALRVAVLLVLLVAAAAVSTLVYFLTAEAEEEEFESSFQASAEKVIISFQEIVSQKLAAIASLGVSFTSYARAQGDEWPFVTMNDFQQRAKTAKDLSSALFLELLPIINDDDRVKWENYSIDNSDWIIEGYEYQSSLNLGASRHLQDDAPIDFSSGIGDRIYRFGGEYGVEADPGPGPYFPVWQSSPVLGRNLVNWNVFSYPPYVPGIKIATEKGEMALGGIDVAAPGDSQDEDLTTSFFAIIQSFAAGEDVIYKGDPMSSVYVPVFDNYDANNAEPVACILSVINWAAYFEGILSPQSKGVTVVLENSCNGPHTFSVNGTDVVYQGAGDLHETRFNDMEVSATLSQLLEDVHSRGDGLKLNQDDCPYTIRVYPSSELEDEVKTSMPVLITCTIGFIFIFTAAVFYIYDRLVERRQSLVLRQAKQSSAIVSSMFPEAVRERLMQEVGETGTFKSKQTKLKSFLDGGMEDEALAKSNQPIADLFPACTVLFADIAGFTAWSSTREPAQVFILLQTVYQAFDLIAKKHKVFKVETIGDSYVAVTGLPNPQARHAVLMCRFAWQCMAKMEELVRELEVSLGPDTADLSMRFGLHSGPVTAGVLQGDRARFQLFGDTVNTAARMESTGIRGRIQISHATASELEEQGKAHWFEKREDAVVAKGKGVLETYWLTVGGSKKQRRSSATSSNDNKATQAAVIQQQQEDVNMKKQNRLIDWTCDILASHVKKIVARRRVMGLPQSTDNLTYHAPVGHICLDEVTEVIKMPALDAKVERELHEIDMRTVELDEAVTKQLREYMAVIASTYNANSFHNFEHACHVTMSVDKLMKRIVAPDVDLDSHDDLYEYTHGINSDPLTLMAIIFSAVIHDVDHRGISNMQLGKEEEQMAALYKNKSIAEQNSLDIAWDLLMSPDFTQLRQAMFTNESELLRFRQAIVNIVLATDIFDKELNDLRKSRWAKAFGTDVVDSNLRATIVIEHIIQASDVSHTMQHWHIYRKWNERLFMEMTAAHKAGRMAANPADFWYKGEIGFFDNYVIPLAKKLKECGVFGVSSDEYLNYAVNNRKEWESRGEGIVQELVEKAATQDA